MVEKIFAVQVDDFDDGDDDDFVLCAERIKLHQNNHLKQHCENNYLKKNSSRIPKLLFFNKLVKVK